MQQSSVDVTTRHAAIIQMMTVAGAGLSILSRACAVVTIWCLMIRCSRRSRYQFWCMTRLLAAADVLVASGDNRGGECGDEEFVCVVSQGSRIHVATDVYQTDPGICGQGV